MLEYSRDIVRLWPEDKKLLELPRDPAQMAYLERHPNIYVAFLSPVLAGLRAAKLAVEDRDPELAQQLEVRAAGLRTDLEAAVLKTTEKDVWGRTVYSKLFGSRLFGSQAAEEMADEA